MKQQGKLFIKNMVCQRCVLTVENILNKLGVPYHKVSLGEAELSAPINGERADEFERELKKVGFELIETRVNKIVEEIKKRVLAYITDQSDDRKRKLSTYIAGHLHYDYSYL